MLKNRWAAGAIVGFVAVAMLFVAGWDGTWLRVRAAGDDRPAGLQQNEAVRIYMPFGMHGVSMLALPIPKTSIPTEAATNTPTPVPTQTPLPCGVLHERVEISAIDVSPREVQVLTDRDRTAWPVMMDIGPHGGGMIAWTGTDGRVHLTPFDAEDQREGPDIDIEGEEVRGLQVHGDGAALLVKRGDVMTLLRIDRDGEVLWEKDLVGNANQSVAGSKWVDGWGREGRLGWDGSRYLAYFGHTQQFGAQGKHQGDLLWYFDSSGEKADGGWDWGCSHSLDVRLTHNGTRFGPVCLSDAFPEKAMLFHHRTRIRPEPSGNESGGSEGRLGGLVPMDDGFAFSFGSPDAGRTLRDIGIVFLDNDGQPGAEHWLTDTSGVDEEAPHLARYGEDFLASWMDGDEHKLALVDEEGALKKPPSSIDAKIGARDDMIRLSNGDPGWAYAWGDMQELKFVRVQVCE